MVPYISEAARCLLEGESINGIDQAMLKGGFPVGPFALLDEVGIDVGTKIIPILVAELGERFAAPAAFDALIKDNRKGRKNGRGFYLYKAKGKKGKKEVDTSVYSLLGVTPKPQMSDADIFQRCVMLMLNEAARCLDEGIIRSARDGDIGAVFGIGFPPFLGGPFRYMDRLGIDNVIEILQTLSVRHGTHFTPCERLLRMKEQNQRFYS